MPALKRFLLLGVLLIVVLATYFSISIGSEIAKRRSNDPAVWKADIQVLESKEAVPDESVLFVGSSSIRFWETLEQDMYPLEVARRGFGGAKVNDVLVYSNRLITNQNPVAIVIYVGGNDVSDSLGNEPKDPRVVLATYKRLILLIRRHLPTTPIYYLALTPGGFSDPDNLERAMTLNLLVETFHRESRDLFFIDANAGLMGDDGQVRSEYMKYDGVHLNRQGYAAWAPAIRTRLMHDSTTWLTPAAH